MIARRIAILFALGLFLWLLLAVVAVTLRDALGHPKPLPRGWLRDALCVHRHEGSWRDPGPTYFGGMQLDLEFQRTYARRLLRRKGTADRWTPHEQLHAARRGWRARGWQPWPAAARKCGLL